jgi:nucleotidyltransferase/DNA polymerase involved in DNA repair
VIYLFAPDSAAPAEDFYARWSPRVEPDELGGVYVELFSGDIRKGAGELLAQTRAALGGEFRAGAAPCKLVARLASRQAGREPIKVVPPEEVRTFLAPLLLADTGWLDRCRREELARLGCHTIGDLACLPEEELLRRFGTEGRRLAAWSRGEDEERVKSLKLPDRWEEVIEREGEEELAAVLARHAGELWEYLEDKGREVGALRLESPAGVSRLRRFPQAPSSPAVLLAAMTALVEEFWREAGGEDFSGFRFVATSRPRSWRQLTLEGKRAGGDLERALGPLRDRYGLAIGRQLLGESRREEVLSFFDPFRLRP